MTFSEPELRRAGTSRLKIIEKENNNEPSVNHETTYRQRINGYCIE